MYTVQWIQFGYVNTEDYATYAEAVARFDEVRLNADTAEAILFKEDKYLMESKRD